MGQYGETGDLALRNVEQQRLSRTKMRGIDHLAILFGDIRPRIDSRLAAGRPVRILDVGCGHAFALMQLLRLYGDRVELHGINYSPASGSIGTMRSGAVQNGVFTDAELDGLAPPTLHYFDACQDWPLKPNSFDIVFSQAAMIWFPDKIRALEQIHRVLSDDGIALIELRLHRRNIPSQYSTSIVVWENGTEVPFEDYVKRFSNLELKFPPRQRWLNPLKRKSRPKKRPYLEMRKASGSEFSFKLVLGAVISIRQICPTWPGGAQCIYRTAEE